MFKVITDDMEYTVNNPIVQNKVLQALGNKKKKSYPDGMKKWTQQEKEKIFECLREGKEFEQIALELDRTVSSVKSMWYSLKHLDIARQKTHVTI